MQFVLGVFDNDESRKLENLRKEQDSVERLLSPLLKQGHLVFYSKYNLGMESLIYWIAEFREEMNWFHFSGHHDKGSGIQLTDGNFESLVTNLRKCPNLKGVFINGCSSQETLLKLADEVPICIGTAKPVYDGVATSFSTMFYKELNTIDDWNDYDRIHEVFETVSANTHSLLENGKIEGTIRGGGALKDFENEFYLISPKTAQGKEQFYTKVVSPYSDKIKKYANNKFLKKLLSELSSNGHAVTYFNEPPYVLGNIIKAFDLNGEIDDFEKNRKFGKERYNLIRQYFYTYLDICRYSILSILWDEINSSSIKTDKNEISELLIPAMAYSTRNISTFRKLGDEIVKNSGKKKERVFVEHLIPSFNLIEVGVEFYDEPLDDVNKHELYWKSELMLHEILIYSRFLNAYRLRSVYSRHYLKHRNDIKPKFELEYSVYGKKPRTSYEEDITVEYGNIHSVYLCQKEEVKEITINLSPFYFDYNSYDPNAKRIDLYVLLGKNFDEGDVEFKYKQVHNPSVNHTDSEFIVVEDSDLNEVALKSKKIYAQLSAFVNTLNIDL